jgi:hypothetical protein
MLYISLCPKDEWEIHLFARHSLIFYHLIINNNCNNVKIWSKKSITYIATYFGQYKVVSKFEVHTSSKDIMRY